MKLVKRPEIFQIEPSSHCNMGCIMCPHPQIEQYRAKQHMDLELYRTIIDRDALPQTKALGFHILGESLLNRNLETMIKYASDRGIQVELATNSSLLTEKRARKLIEAGLKKVWLSFDGGTKETYETIRIGGVFEKVVANMTRFLELNEQYGHPVYTTIQMVGQRANAHDLDNFYQLWAGKGADEVKVKFLDTWAGTLMLDDAPEPPVERHPCEEPFNRVAVLANGDVVPCCRDWAGAYVYGNLREQSLEEIWHGRFAKELREEHLTGDYQSEPCKSCREWHIPMNRSISTDPDMEKRQLVQIPLYLQEKVK